MLLFIYRNIVFKKGGIKVNDKQRKENVKKFKADAEQWNSNILKDARSYGKFFPLVGIVLLVIIVIYLFFS